MGNKKKILARKIIDHNLREPTVDGAFVLPAVGLEEGTSGGK